MHKAAGNNYMFYGKNVPILVLALKSYVAVMS
jgi:hypothetical protein